MTDDEIFNHALDMAIQEVIVVGRGRPDGQQLVLRFAKSRIEALKRKVTNEHSGPTTSNPQQEPCIVAAGD